MDSLSNRALLVNNLLDLALYAGNRVVSAVGMKPPHDAFGRERCPKPSGQRSRLETNPHVVRDHSLAIRTTKIIQGRARHIGSKIQADGRNARGNPLTGHIAQQNLQVTVRAHLDTVDLARIVPEIEIDKQAERTRIRERQYPSIGQDRLYQT